MSPVKAQHAMATHPGRSHDKFLIIWKKTKTKHYDDSGERGREMRCAIIWGVLPVAKRVVGLTYFVLPMLAAAAEAHVAVSRARGARVQAGSRDKHNTQRVDDYPGIKEETRVL